MSSTSSPPDRDWVPFLVLALAALLAHGLSLRADFYMDDRPHILLNERVQTELDAPQGFKSRHLTYAIWRGVHLAFGENPVAYHAVNLLLHVGVVLLFLPVARRFLRLNTALTESRQASLAFWGTLFFAVHPLVSEPVNYAAQTSILLMTGLATLATYGFLRWHESRRTGFLVLTALAVLLASHAKEPGIFHALIPLFFLGALFVNWRDLKQRLAADGRLRLGLLGVGGILATIFATSWMINAWMRLSDFDRFTNHALTQARVLFAYLGRVLFPVQLSSDHHIPWSTSWGDVPALIGLLLVVGGALALLYYSLRHRSWLAALLGMGLFHLFIRFAYPVDELMVEYRLYPAMPWFGIALALGITQLLAWRPGGISPRWETAVLGGLAALGIVLSANRARVWGNEDRLVLDVIRQYPDNLRAWGIHLSHLAACGDYEQLLRFKKLPQEVAMKLISPEGRNWDRQFSGEKTYVNYITCQYPLIMGLVHTGELEEALRRTDILLVDVLKKAPTKNHVSVFTVALAKLLCHTARGESDEVEKDDRENPNTL